MKGLIISGGEKVKDSIIKKYYDMSDIRIGVDRGIEELIDLKLEYDLAIGDFDSIAESYFDMVKKDNKYIELEVEKDLSDTEYAIDYLIDRGAEEIYLLSATGSRLDHSITNILSLKKSLDKNISIYIVDNNNRIQILNGKYTIFKEYENISIIPISLDGIKITLKGFYYGLYKDKIEFGSSRCLSNYLLDKEGEIDIESGLALLIESND